MAKKKRSGKRTQKDIDHQVKLLMEEEAKEAALPKWSDDHEILAPVEDEKQEKDSKKKDVVQSIFARERVITESSDEARTFYAKSNFGTIIDAGRVQLSLLEALYLLEKGKLEIIDKKEK